MRQAIKKKEKIKPIILFLLIMTFITGCAARYRPSKASMIPSTSQSSFFSSDKILKVENVLGPPITFTSPSYKINPQDFTEALNDALKNSRIFKKIITEEQADYRLQTEIISQEVTTGFNMEAILFVHYTLIDTKTNQVVWKENLVSQYTSTFEDAFEGSARAKLATEGVVRNNLTQLLNKLSKVLDNFESR